MSVPKLMNNSILTLAQIGCGYWGPNLLRNFSSQPNCHVKWLADQVAERRQYVEANFPKTRTAINAEDVLADFEVDAVVIATPAASHFALAKMALGANKHVFVEKPLAMSVAETDILTALAAQHNRVLMVGHTFLFNGAVRYVKNMLDRGEIGQPHYIYSQRLNLGQVRNDVNAWWNLAPHDISILIHWMNGELPVSITASGKDYLQPGVEDIVFATLQWTNGIIAQVQVSWLDPGKVRKMTLVGSRKMVIYDDVGDDKISIFDKGFDRVPRLGERMDFDTPNSYRLQQRAGDVLLPRVDFPEPLKVESAHFLECVRTGATPITGPSHARSVVAVLEAGQQALRQKRVVSLSDILVSSH